MLDMKVYRKRRNPVRRWLHKYSITLFLLGLFLAGVLIGALIVGLFSSSAEAVEIEETTSVSLEPTARIVLETEPQTITPTESSFYFNVPLSQELQDYIRSVSDEYDVPMELILAMIDVESTFDPNTISGTDDYGLMQINSINFESLSEGLGVTNFLDPKQNILCGTYIISQHLRATGGDVTKAIMYYNNGPTGAEILWKQGICSTEYTAKINKAYESYKKESRHDGRTS